MAYYTKSLNRIIDEVDKNLLDRADNIFKQYSWHKGYDYLEKQLLSNPNYGVEFVILFNTKFKGLNNATLREVIYKRPIEAEQREFDYQKWTGMSKYIKNSTIDTKWKIDLIRVDTDTIYFIQVKQSNGPHREYEYCREQYLQFYHHFENTADVWHDFDGRRLFYIVASYDSNWDRKEFKWNILNGI